MATVHQRFSSEDRREQILKVATKLFASRGYEGATTREIANLAKVNEAIIFRHFPTKEDLYWAVIDRKCQSNPGRELLRQNLAECKDLRETFITIGERILRRRHEDQTMTRLMLFSALESHRLSQRFFQTYVADYYILLGEFISKKVEEGVLRPLDPELTARGFLGMVIYHSMIEELFGGREGREFTPREAAEALVDIWLTGVLSAKPNGRSNRVKAAPGKVKSEGQQKSS